MTAKKGLLLIFIVIVVLGGAGLFIFSRKEPTNNNDNNDGKIILFYREDCPHCIKVEEYVKENKIDEKITFERKEVLKNKDNANLLFKKAEICGIAKEKVGVPLLWDGSKCIIGDTNIINFFKEKTNG